MRNITLPIIVFNYNTYIIYQKNLLQALFNTKAFRHFLSFEVLLLSKYFMCTYLISNMMSSY